MNETLQPPWLTDEEIDRLCKPLKQRSAQTRWLCAMLGVKRLERRPDGLPLVGRKMAEAVLNSAKPEPRPATAGPNWSK